MAEIDYFTEIGRKINEAIITEWQAQRHSLTGAFEKSMRENDSVKVSQENGLIIVEGYGRDYWKYINFGVLASAIKYPFAPARIKGLTGYLKLKIGLDDKKARGMAYAVATKHKREGMPQPFATRTKFVDNALDRIAPELDKIIEKQIGLIIDQNIQL